jgi:hypothetical protein
MQVFIQQSLLDQRRPEVFSLFLKLPPPPYAHHGKGKKPGWETAMNRNLAHLSLILVLTGRHLRIADNLTHKHTHTRDH